MKDNRNINRFAPSPNTSNLDLGFLPEDARILATSEQGIIVFESPHPQIYYNVVYHPSLHYKILRLSQHKKEPVLTRRGKLYNTYCCEVFDSVKGEWRLLELLLVPFGVSISHKPMITTRGFVYMLLDNNEIWKFDVPSEQWTTFLPPIQTLNYGFHTSNNLVKYGGSWGLLGQSLVVCGSELVLGSGNVKKVDDAKNVLRWEVGNKWNLVLPDGVENGKTGSDSLPFKSAFKDVIFCQSGSLAIEKPLGVVQNQLENEDSVIVQFKICCPSIAEGTSVLVVFYALQKIYKHITLTGLVFLLQIYVICNSIELGKWKEEWKCHEDVGVGEFLDLKLVVDWAVDSGFHLLQLLLINDTSVHKMWWESYPYTSLCIALTIPQTSGTSRKYTGCENTENS
uniref:4-alpha-glucanotransferase DPE2 n=1 Tax=Tanacetum cinerariifolium TaxID=118510 RepID=A0A6L2JD83_TANCI|nr:4-alpha-glucanotransferase DPE2 [Tanacetum cinerariifolium]